MKDDKLIEHIRETLSKHEVAVSDKLWNKIEQGLPAPVRPRIRFRYYSAAAMLAVIAAITLFLTTQRNDIPPVTPQQHMAAVERIKTGRENKQSPVQTVTATTISNDTVCEIVFAEAVNAPKCDTNKECKEVIPEIIPKTEAIENVIDTPALAPNFPNRIIDTTPTQAIAKITGLHKTPRNIISVKVNSMTAQTTPVQQVTRSTTSEIIYRHNMPLALKATFEKRFGRWSAGSGVTYTYMNSDYETTDKSMKGYQNLHYLGIPLYAGFEIAQVKRFSFYASAGGEIDFNIAGNRHEKSETGNYTEKKSETVREKKPQFSLQAHVGAAFELFRNFDLYLEPTLGYYFPNSSTIHNIWHDRPWNVSLSLGLRTGF